MTTRTIIAIALIALGIFAFAYQGINFTTKEKAVDIGPVQVTREERHSMPLPPIVGGIALVGGILLLLVGYKKA